jgi:hypothetical protein
MLGYNTYDVTIITITYYWNIFKTMQYLCSNFAYVLQNLWYHFYNHYILLKHFKNYVIFMFQFWLGVTKSMISLL